MPQLNIAIVGSGPAGMYLAEALLKLFPEAIAIDVIDRLPTPFGLIRSGVAPDHATVRAVTRRFEQALERPGVRLIGSVEIGRDLTLEQLRELYDVVALANGCPLDKSLGIPGEHLPGVWGSARFTGWYNAHPDHAGMEVADLPDTVVVIGNGNVAIDVARLLTKPESALAATDMSHLAIDVLGRSQVRKVVLSGRRGPLDARFSVKELEELGDVARVSLALPQGVSFPDAAEISALPAAQSAMLQALVNYATAPPGELPREIEFQFLARPAEILGQDRVEAIRFERMALGEAGLHATGTFFDIPCGAVVTCIGYHARPLAPLEIDARSGGFANDDARIDSGLYCTGWARRGPSGTIATNRVDAGQVAARIAQEVQARGTAGPAGLDALLRERNVTATDLAAWRLIDRAETARASGTAPRQKFHSIDEMLDVLRNQSACEATT